MPSRFAAVTNKKNSQLIKQASCSRNIRRRWRSYEVKLCLFYSNLSIKPVKRFFVYKCKLSLSLALLYLVDFFVNKHNTKFHNLFLQNDFKYKKNSQLLSKKFSRKSYTNVFKSFICRQEKATAVRSLGAKNVIVGNSIWVKNHHFCAKLSHRFSIYWNNYSPQCRWLVVYIYPAASQLSKLLRLATSTSVNNCYISYGGQIQ